jgi:hypothetical protein
MLALHDASASPIPATGRHKHVEEVVEEEEASPFRGTPFFDRMQSAGREKSSSAARGNISKSLDGLLQDRITDPSLLSSEQNSLRTRRPVASPSLSPRNAGGVGERRGVSTSLLDEARSRYRAIIAARSDAVRQSSPFPHKGAISPTYVKATRSSTPPSTHHRIHQRGQQLLDPPSPSDAALLSTRSMSLVAPTLTAAHPSASMDAVPVEASPHYRHPSPHFLAPPVLDTDEMLDGTTWTEWLRSGAGEDNKLHVASVLPHNGLNTTLTSASSSRSPSTKLTKSTVITDGHANNDVDASSNKRRGSPNIYLSRLAPALLSRVSPPQQPPSLNAASERKKVPSQKLSRGAQEGAEARAVVISTPVRLPHHYADGAESDDTVSYIIAPARKVDAPRQGQK